MLDCRKTLLCITLENIVPLLISFNTTGCSFYYWLTCVSNRRYLSLRFTSLRVIGFFVCESLGPINTRNVLLHALLKHHGRVVILALATISDHCIVVLSVDILLHLAVKKVILTLVILTRGLLHGSPSLQQVYLLFEFGVN